MRKNLILITGLILICSCAQNASWHSNEVAKADKNSLTLGEVQRNIHKGMSGSQVIETLGSPNVVSTDENGNEVWIYDKFSTEAIASGSNGTTFSLSRIGSGAVRTSQSTMTAIIKFNAEKKVRDVAYHKSSF
jgi:outer membrane protein assembly factor BamE (lipoprotein component of BamABCDE complex)